MDVIERIKHRFDVTRISGGTVISVKYLAIDDADIAELKAMQERIAALESENARLRELDEWRPIAEAPRDAKNILILGENGLYHPAEWDTELKEWVTLQNEFVVIRPTHYFLLPPPPEAAHG